MTDQKLRVRCPSNGEPRHLYSCALLNTVSENKNEVSENTKEAKELLAVRIKPFKYINLELWTFLEHVV